MDLIERQAAIDALADMHCKSDEDGYVWIIRSDAWARIDALPSVTPKRKMGKWIHDNTLKYSFCSECGAPSLTDDDRYIYSMDFPNFCPNCGARMTEEDI